MYTYMYILLSRETGKRITFQALRIKCLYTFACTDQLLIRARIGRGPLSLEA